MNKRSKICWAIFAISFVILLGARFIQGGWFDYLWIPLGMAGISFIGAMIFDIKLYIDFLTMRTTKHGMNMGAMILSVVALIVVVNYFSVRKNQTWDFTEEKLHSLADQTKDLLKNLKGDLEAKVFYHGEGMDQQYNQQKARIVDSLTKFQSVNSNVRIQLINAYEKVELSQEYLKGVDESKAPVVFLVYNDTKIRVENPAFEEQQLTNALLRATRTGSKKIYFLTGNGERSISDKQDGGIQTFANNLKDSAFTVEEINLLEKEGVPDDADVLAIIGPTVPLAPGVLDKVRDYARKGGRLFVAADPGGRHGIGRLTETFGVKFDDNYIFALIAQQFRKQPTTAIGVEYDRNHEITQRIRGMNVTMFDVASSLSKAENSPAGLQIVDLVMSDQFSVATEALTRSAFESAMQAKKNQKYTLVKAVSGKLPSAEGEDDKKGVAESSENFAAVIFGDSDFLTEKNINDPLNMNLDFSANTIAFLAKETDLISIRPKNQNSTKFEMTQFKGNFYIVGAIAFPILLGIISIILWFRRRGA